MSAKPQHHRDGERATGRNSTPGTTCTRSPISARSPPRARASSRAPRACYLYDTEGQQILDAMSGLWCVNIGYGRNELADVAARQMRELPYYNSFFKSANPPAIELAQLLAS